MNGPGTHLHAPAALSGRAIRMAAALEDWPRRTLRLEEVWVIFDQADPASTSAPERRRLLADTLTELETHRLLTQAKTRDATARPALPTQVRLPTSPSKETADTLKRSVAWRPELDWIYSARLTVGQVERLRQVNLWLRDRGADDDVLPVRERSLEVFGHEKTLDKVLRTSLFAPTRLTMWMLRTVRTHPPLPAVRLGPGQRLLVVENDNTFHTLRMHLQQRPGDFGWIAWGAGGAFEASVRSVGELDGVKVVYYFGDLDADGLRIPCAAADTAQREDLPPVLPAKPLYRSLLGTGVRQGGQPPLEGERADELVAWLGDDVLVQSVRALLVSGVRIPQEALNGRLVPQIGRDLS